MKYCEYFFYVRFISYLLKEIINTTSVAKAIIKDKASYTVIVSPPFMAMILTHVNNSRNRVIGQKVCVKSAVNLDRYWVYSTFIFF